LPQRLAAIDVGSNTILLLVAEHDPASGLSIIDEAEDQPRLGSGLGNTGRLGEAAIERALLSLSRMRDRATELGATQIQAVATAAVREAANGADFVERARREGIPLRVISPEAEANLAYRSAASHFPGFGRTLVADIGGGSLELIGARNGAIELIDSVPLGAVRLTEMQLDDEALRDHIRHRLGSTLDPNVWRESTAVGSGGTFANLASMALARRGAEGAASIQGVRVTAAELRDVLSMLAGMSPEQRRRVPGLRPERADIILAGLTVADELLSWVKADGISVNRYGLREGLLLEMIG
jgi:exopolyphosphatase/guanosine-5'-triphosphate,3'-diphosphate pyrophosphatase